MKNELTLSVLAWLFILLLSGCGKEATQAIPIDDGIDICQVCNMGIADDPFATEVILTNGRVYKFDDIGCMHEWLKDQTPSQIEAKFVRDYHTSTWIPLEQATFAFDPAFHTPMGYGMYSFQNKKMAEEWIQKDGKGKSLSPDELQQHEWVRHDVSIKNLKKQLMEQESISKEN